MRTALGAACRGLWSNCNHLGMLAITECLSDPLLSAEVESARARLRGLLTGRAEHFTRLAAGAGLVHPRYEGGFFVTVFTPAAERAAERMRAAGVFVVPIPGAVRVALCSTPSRSIARLVETLADAVRAAGG